jgi:hypothetical protein
MLMGGQKLKENIKAGIVADFVSKIDNVDKKRALEVSAFYNDLGSSIKKVARSIKRWESSLHSWKQNC